MHSNTQKSAATDKFQLSQNFYNRTKESIDVETAQGTQILNARDYELEQELQLGNTQTKSGHETFSVKKQSLPNVMNQHAERESFQSINV